MKKLFSICLVLITSSVLAQNFSYTPKWKKGDEFTATTITEKKEWDHGKLKDEERTEMDAKIVVRSLSKKNYIIQVTYKDFVLNTYSDVYDKLGEDRVEHAVLKLKYRVSKDGKNVDLMNWQEARNVVFGVNDDMMNKIVNASDSSASEEKKEMVKGIMKPLMKIFDNKETMESYFESEIKAFTSPFQSEYNKKDTVVTSYREKNPMGKKNDSLSATVRSWVVAENKGVVTLGSVEEMDMKEFMDAMKEMMNKMMSMFGKMGVKEGEEMSEERKAKLEKKKAKQQAMLDNMHFDMSRSSEIEYNSKKNYVTKYVAKGSFVAKTMGKDSKSSSVMTVTFTKD